MVEAIVAALALVVGLGIGWFVWGRQLASASDELRSESVRRAAAETNLEHERRALQASEDTQARLSDTFKALSSEALNSNNAAFLELARQALEVQHTGAKADLEKRQQAITELVAPVKVSLEKFETKVSELEKIREGAYAGLTEQVRSLLASQIQLRTETTNLVQALRAPQVRGRWGEIQLRRVVEMAGMLNHCDFYEQESREGEAGRLRPDLVVRLPAGKTIVVDAKAPITSYVDAVALTSEDERRAKLADYARLVRSHVTALGRKAYWDQFEASPELVVLFLPGEHYFGAALEQDPELIEFGVDQKVIIATPTTLISLLRAVAYGWRQEALAENAQEVADLGKLIYERIATMAKHWSSVGDRLESAVNAYNDASGSLETRVLVSARKLKELKAGAEGEEIKPVEPVDLAVRKLQVVPNLPKPSQE